MKCLYREKIYRCGEYLEVEVFPVFKKANGGRRAKYKPTNEMQARLNQRRAERALIRILNGNFTEDDISVTLTFDAKSLPETFEEAERAAKNFLRRVKRLRKKKGLDEIKYVIIPGSGRFHFHIPMSGGLDAKELATMWPYGYCNVIFFRFNENGIEGHAKYIANQFDEDQYGGEDLLSMFDVDEETGEVRENSEGSSSSTAGGPPSPILGKAKRAKGKRRYSCSKNIVRPVAEERDGEITSARVEELATVDSGSRKAFERLYPGYCFSDCKPYYNAENGGYYLQVKMYRQDASFLQTMKKFKQRRSYG